MPAEPAKVELFAPEDLEGVEVEAPEDFHDPETGDFAEEGTRFPLLSTAGVLILSCEVEELREELARSELLLSSAIAALNLKPVGRAGPPGPAQPDAKPVRQRA